MEQENRIWVPSTSEIFTESGWTPILYAFNMAQRAPLRLLTADRDKRKVGFQKSSGWAKRDFDGKINRMTEGLLKMEFLTAFPIWKSEILDLVEPDTTPVFRQVNYTGVLYSFDVPKGITMLRCQYKVDSSESDVVSGIPYLLDDYTEDVVNEEPEYEGGCDALGIPDWWMSLTRW